MLTICSVPVTIGGYKFEHRQFWDENRDNFNISTFMSLLSFGRAYLKKWNSTRPKMA